MPGWFVHMEAAHQAAARLRAGAVPPTSPMTPEQANDLGEICHRWRNYLALGALGPDLFYLLPDFEGTKGCVIRQVVQWVLDVWEVIDEEFVSKWEKWISPITNNAEELASQLTGGLSAQLGQVLEELASALVNALLDLLSKMGDWFGLLTSGPPQGFGDSAFYWSDIFHYRRTYQFPFELYRQARAALEAAADDDASGRYDAEARIAFAIGWMSHCATDVTGHPFTNAKSGGPYRDHWQRHHLVENHIDAQNYGAINPGPLYGEYGTSALHFRAAFRGGSDGPYAGRQDQPAYDYFAGFPPYNNGDGIGDAAERAEFFDLDSAELPDHLVGALLDAMAVVHPDGPKILTEQPAFSASDGGGHADGRPNTAAMAEMWQIAYRYLKSIGSDGLSPRKPSPPSVFTDHSFPTPPGGGGAGVDDDPSRGADTDDDDFNLLDLLLALFAWAIYVVEVAVWLATVLPGLITDIATFPAREVVYWSVVVPAWDLMMLARRPLVMAGFLMPKPEEIDLGLTILGTNNGFNIAAALDDPLGEADSRLVINEPSGRRSTSADYGLDRGYPRNVVRDTVDDIADAALASYLNFSAAVPYVGDAAVTFHASEWIAPWRYPLSNVAGQAVPPEGERTHVGPYVVGDMSTVLLSGAAGDDEARTKLEVATNPAKTEQALTELLPSNRHLGSPTDYSVYLVGKMVAGYGSPDFSVPDFNLDSDRGYAWHCWDWLRHSPDDAQWRCRPDFLNTADFSYAQPCTPPQFFNAKHDNPSHPDNLYNPTRNLRVRYLDDPTAPPKDCGLDLGHLPPIDFHLDWRRHLGEGRHDA